MRECDLRGAGFVWNGLTEDLNNMRDEYGEYGTTGNSTDFWGR